MNELEKKSLTVYLIALTIIFANLIVFSVIYQVPFLSELTWIRKSLPLVSLAAVYPADLFRMYLKEELAIQFFWIMSVMISAFGLLVFNRFARTVFIVFSIIHFVVLGVISSFFVGQFSFWGYFFKCYFNLVIFLVYVGYLTLPEVRAQFLGRTRELRFDFWFLKIRRKTLLPGDAQGFFNLAVAYQRLGRADEALEFLSRAVAIVPDRVDYHFKIGEINFDRKDYAAAINALRETVRLDPINLNGRYLLGLAFQKTGCSKEAVQEFRRCCHLSAQNGEIFRELGIACFHSGHWAEAEPAFLKALTLLPADPKAPYYLGLMMVKDRKRSKDAEEYFKKAVRLAPDFIDGYRELGHLYVSMGDYKQAVRAFRDVLHLDENQTPAHYHLGFSYAMLNDMESARREYNYLKEVDPDLARTLGLLLSKS